MEGNLHNRRKIYAKNELVENQLTENPMEMFRNWYLEAEKSSETEANAMAISTIENNNKPRTRMVLLKQYTWEGFIFYTNYDSRKGKALATNPETCLHFYWPFLERQIIINGIAEKIAENLSDGYFHSRPRGSQLGAIVSNQSEIIENREALEQKLKNLEIQSENKELSRPKNWGGYLVKPYEIEFWQGRPNRLHDRILYQLRDDFSWKISRLSP